MYIALGKKVYKEDIKYKSVMTNIAFTIATVIIVTSMKRAREGRTVYGNSNAGESVVTIIMSILIAAFLGYIANAKSFETLCKSGNNFFDKEMTQRVASFGFTYIMIWKVLSPLFEKAMGGNVYNLNMRKTQMVAIVYIVGIIELISMQFLRKSIFKEDEGEILKSGGLIAGSMLLFFMILFSVNSTRY